MSGDPPKPRLLLVTGTSGAGKSTVLDALEDMGWDIVDNLPADLLGEFVHGADQCRTAPVAIGMVVARLGVPPADALALLRAHAYASASSLAAVASAVVSRHLDLSDPRDGSGRSWPGTPGPPRADDGSSASDDR